MVTVDIEEGESSTLLAAFSQALSSHDSIAVMEYLQLICGFPSILHTMWWKDQSVTNLPPGKLLDQLEVAKKYIPICLTSRRSEVRWTNLIGIFLSL